MGLEVNRPNSFDNSAEEMLFCFTAVSLYTFLAVFPEDVAILTLAWKLNYVQDIVLIAHILDIDLAKYKGTPNDKFLPAFVEECNKILQAAGASKTIVLDPAYLADFEVPQILHNIDTESSIFISVLGTEQPSFQSVYQ